MDKKEVRLVLAKGAMEKIRIYMGHRGDIEKCARNVFSGIPLVFLLHCSHADMNKNFAVDRRDNDISLSDTHAVDPKIIALSADADTVRPLPEDTLSYFLKLKKLANNDRSGRWPPVTAFPGQGALLPYNRIVAYYGNFFSTKMGILGSHPPEIMLQKLRAEVIQWEKADTATPVKPALHYIAVTAQRLPGADGKYRLRMPFREIDKAVLLAKEVKGLVFLDVQVGFSTLQQEIPLLEKYLLMPEVHLGIDPEYSMKGGQLPGTAVGSFDAADINYAVTYLSGLVKKNELPPKILVVHRFTQNMITDFKKIKTCPEVQIVVNMDGFGFPAKKKNTYYHCIFKEPVQFAGFKLFYINDVQTVKQLMTPEEILKLVPQPIYIQYQ